MAKARLKDIATKAGVSEATVSLVLSGKGNISTEVREKVIQTANHLGYSKGASQKPGERKLFRKVGILFFVEQDDPYQLHSIWEMVRQIESELKEFRYVSIVLPIEASLSYKEILEIIMLSGAGAIFTIGFGNPELFHKLENMNIPAVVINDHRYIDKYFTICSDEFQGAYEGVHHYLEEGSRNILYISDKSESNNSVFFDRKIGVSKALSEYGLELNSDNHLEFFLDDHSAFLECKSYIIQADAICISDPATAIMLFDALPDIKTSKSLVVLGADYISEKWPLNTIPVMAVHYEQMGRTAAKVMLDRLNNKDNLNQALKIKPHLKHLIN